MSSEDTLIQIRKEKHLNLNGGGYPLASNGLDIKDLFNSSNDVIVSLDPKDLGESVTIRGRITNFRRNGALTFIKLRDGSGSIQIIASRNVYQGYDSDLKLLDIGDIIEVSGPLCMSKTGELSILFISFNLLTKAHRPPPEKFVGITDTELKYRKRYLDLISSGESRAIIASKAIILKAIREYLDGLDFIEVETSTLNSVSSGANAKPFSTHHNALDKTLFLRIAPELYLKRLVVGGMDRVFEIGRCYRNEGLSPRHNPEFTMLEYYQAYGNFNDLLSNTQDMLRFINNYFISSAKKNDSFQRKYGVDIDEWVAQRSFTLNEFKIIPMWSAVIKAACKMNLLLNIHPLADHKPNVVFECINLNNSRVKMLDLECLNSDLQKASSVGEQIYILFEAIAEPFLTEDYRTEDNKFSVPVFITEYPSEVSPLARRNDHNSRVCDRFELFIDGRELCNAFQELNNPEEQARRFKEQLETNNKDPMDYDSDYIEALEHGLPPTIGFGMGIDRAIALFTNSKSIKDVIAFPTLKPIK